MRGLIWAHRRRFLHARRDLPTSSAALRKLTRIFAAMASAAPPVLMLLLLGLLLGPQGAARSPEPAAALKTLPPLPSSFDEVYGKQMLYMVRRYSLARTRASHFTHRKR